MQPKQPTKPIQPPKLVKAAKIVKPVKPVKRVRDWANTALYKFIAEEHYRDLLKRNIVKLNEGEKRPLTPE
jgi:hypothetical protein